MTYLGRLTYLVVASFVMFAALLGQQVHPEAAPPGALQEMKEIFGYIQLFERLLPPEEGSLASLTYSPERLVKQRAEVVRQIGLNRAQGEILIRFAELYGDSKKEMDERYRQLHLQRSGTSAPTDKDRTASLRVFADQMADVNRLVIELQERLDDQGERLLTAYLDQTTPNIKFGDGGTR